MKTLVIIRPKLYNTSFDGVVFFFVCFVLFYFIFIILFFHAQLEFACFVRFFGMIWNWNCFCFVSKTNKNRRIQHQT